MPFPIKETVHFPRITSHGCQFVHAPLVISYKSVQVMLIKTNRYVLTGLFFSLCCVERQVGHGVGPDKLLFFALPKEKNPHSKCVACGIYIWIPKRNKSPNKSLINEVQIKYVLFNMPMLYALLDIYTFFGLKSLIQKLRRNQATFFRLLIG